MKFAYYREKEKADVDNIAQPSVKAFLKQQGTWEQKVNKEQQEYLDSLNKQEISDKVSYKTDRIHISVQELKGAKLQYERAARIADIYKQQTDTMNELYEKQDKMLGRLEDYGSYSIRLFVLAGIFGNQYASERENSLEAELDDALEWQQRVSLAKFKWSNGRVLLVHACTQMAFGITRWKELEAIESR